MTHPRILAVAVVLLLSSCSSAPKEEAREGKDSRDRDSLFATGQERTGRGALAVPPDLLESATEKVRENQTGVAAAFGGEVLPVVTAANIRTGDGRSYLAVDADAEVVWRKLTEFWAFEEIDLVEFRPGAGLMETDWFVKTPRRSGGIGGIAVEFFEAFTARLTAHDKFIIRLERNGDGTNLYVTHRSREKVEKPGSNKEVSDFEWVEREQDDEKVAQLLQTIVLLFGADDGLVDEPA